MSLPIGIPRETTIGDACPVTCNSCDFLRKRLQELIAARDHDSKGDSTECLQVEFMVRSLDNEALFQSFTSNFHKEAALSQFITTLSGFYRVNGVKVRYFVGTEAITGSAAEYLKIAPMEGRLKEFEMTRVPASEWAFGFKSTGGIAQARSVFIAPGLPPPLFDESAVPRGTRALDLVGQMYRPIPGVGGPLPKASNNVNSEAKGGLVTGWIDSSASASVISPVVEKVAGHCLGQPYSGCCGARSNFEKFLSGPCGVLIYSRVVSDDELQSFCFERNQLTEASSEDNEDKISCYESAMRIVDALEEKAGGICELTPHLKVLVDVWCSKDGVSRLIDEPEEVRRDPNKKFCFPTIKTTLQQRFDLFYVATLSDVEMSTMCAVDSCTRQHLRYVDALTQLQVGWELSGASSSGSILLASADSPIRLLRDGVEQFQIHMGVARRLVASLESQTWNATDVGMKILFQSNRPVERRLTEQSTSSSFGIYVADFPEQFLNFVCNKVKDSYCQQTLLLLTDEDLVHNPTLLQGPCETECFVPMTGRLSGLVQSFGEREGNPYYKALGSILRSYGRFYCTRNSDGKYCGEYLFNKIRSPRFVHNTPTAIPPSALTNCRCSLSFLNDGQCDPDCFNEECQWDGEDCRVPVMFPEAYYALLDVFAEAETGAPPESRLSMRANTTCLVYDPAFTCGGKCRRLYEAGSNLQGCCFSAALDSLGSLLQVEMEHKGVAKTNRWITDRSFSYIEQSCSATLDRTCMEGSQRTIVKLDITIDNLSPLIISKSAISTSNGKDSDDFAKSLVEVVRQSISRNLLLVENDVARIILRPSDSGTSVEVSLDAGRESQRVETTLQDPVRFTLRIDSVTQFFC